MVAVTSTSAYTAQKNYGTAYAAIATGTSARSSTTTSTVSATQTAASTVTLSEEALAALAERSFEAVVTDARTKLTTLLEQSGRTSPLSGERLALDISSLDARELYALSSSDSFTADQRKAAGLEMQRRFEAALSGPAAIAEVTGEYTALYKAAASYLDRMGAEEKASSDWKASREAVTEGLKQLAKAPTTLPDAGSNDPVSLYLTLADAARAKGPSMSDLAANTRSTLDQLYAQARTNGKVPSFNRHTTTGQYIDVSDFSGRALSAMILNTDGAFSTDETRAARSVMQARSGSTLLAGFQNASKSSDPTAFSQNIIAAFSSLSSEERQAVGWSDELYQTAMQSYVSTSKLMSMFQGATAPNGSAMPSLATLLGRAF